MIDRDIDRLLEKIALLEVDQLFLEQVIKKLKKENKKLKKKLKIKEEES